MTTIIIIIIIIITSSYLWWPLCCTCDFLSVYTNYKPQLAILGKRKGEIWPCA
jgi:hypothetical protein